LEILRASETTPLEIENRDRGNKNKRTLGNLSAAAAAAGKKKIKKNKRAISKRYIKGKTFLLLDVTEVRKMSLSVYLNLSFDFHFPFCV
jgi:hypothetical protein